MGYLLSKLLGTPGASTSAGMTQAAISAGLLSADQKAALLPLASPVMVSNRGGFVGFDTLREAVLAYPTRDIVVNASQVIIEEDTTLPASVYSNGARLIVAPDVVLTLSVGASLFNLVVSAAGTPGLPNAGRVQLSTSQAPNVVPNPAQSLRLMDCRLNLRVACTAPGHGITCRGTSTIADLSLSTAGIIYLYDQSQVGAVPAGMTRQDARPIQL